MKNKTIRTLTATIALCLGANGATHAQNNLWGVTTDGGLHGHGALFQLNTTTNAWSEAYYLDSSDGLNVYEGLINYNNILYGTAADGGAHAHGTIFSYDPATTSFTRLYSFDSTSGSRPVSVLLAYNNKLYGTATTGGTGNNGVLFSFDPATGTYTVLHQFTGTDGASPEGNLLVYNGTMYGIATYGGTHNQGTLYSYDLTAGTFTKLNDYYDDPDYSGKYPVGLTHNNDTLIVVCELGGPGGGDGILQGYSINTGGIYMPDVFALDYGIYPEYPPVLYNGKMWGFTPAGGTNPSIDPGTAGTLYAFDASSVFANISYRYNFDSTLGSSPTGTPLVSNNTFYAGSTTGGHNNIGTIFKYDPTTDTYTKLHDFDSTGGYHPYGNLVMAPAANLAVATIIKPQYTVNVYPNPAHAAFSITLNGTPVAFLTLTDVAGHTLIHHTITSGNNTINTAGLPAGVYTYMVTAKCSTQAGKLQVQ